MFRKIIFTLVTLILIVTVTYVLTHNNSPKNKMVITQYSTIPQKTFSDLVNDSYLIIRGNVKDILPSKWSNPNFMLGNDIRNILQTDIEFTIGEVYKGTPYNSNTINVRIDKGYDENVIVKSDGYPDFYKGENVVLFLSKDDSDVAKVNEQYYVLTGMLQGVFKSTNDLIADKIYLSESKAIMEQLKLSDIKNKIDKEIQKN